MVKNNNKVQEWDLPGVTKTGTTRKLYVDKTAEKSTGLFKTWSMCFNKEVARTFDVSGPIGRGP